MDAETAAKLADLIATANGLDAAEAERIGALLSSTSEEAVAS
jgi:hypothetical protein